MFPEIVGRVCIDAAVIAYSRQPLPSELVTPFAVLTTTTISDFYEKTIQGWEIRWKKVTQDLDIPNPMGLEREEVDQKPHRIGFIVPFSEHEWYQSLVKTMREYAASMGIEFEIVDVHQSLRDEVDLRRREIAASCGGVGASR